MFNMINTDEFPVIILNGGQSAFTEVLMAEGPSELIENLKNQNFIKTYGEINVAESIFEYPYRPREDLYQFKLVYNIDHQLEKLIQSYPDPGSQIIGFYLTPHDPTK